MKKMFALLLVLCLAIAAVSALAEEDAASAETVQSADPEAEEALIEEAPAEEPEEPAPSEAAEEAAPPAGPRFCPWCGAPVAMAGALFCSACGKRLDGSN